MQMEDAAILQTAEKIYWIGWLKLLKDEQIVDIRKIYKSGVTDSVLDSYRSYLKQ